jgi:hypothetical protein
LQLYAVQHILVVCVLDEVPQDAFLLIQGLLQPKQVGVELLLQAFIGVVDAQLLKAVPGKALEAINVQDGDAAPRTTPFNPSTEGSRVLQT